MEPNYQLDVAKVQVNSAQLAQEMEQITINFDSDSTGVMMTFNWDRTVVTVPISK